MSRLRTLAFAIKDRLEEIPELKGRVIVFRRYDVDSEFEKRMAKTRGRAVIVRLLSAKNESKSKSSHYEGAYTVSLFTAPTLTQKDAKDADDLLGEIEGKLHGWWPESMPSNRAMYLTADRISFPDHPHYDVASLVIKSPLQSLKPIPTP